LCEKEENESEGFPLYVEGDKVLFLHEGCWKEAITLLLSLIKERKSLERKAPLSSD